MNKPGKLKYIRRYLWAHWTVLRIMGWTMLKLRMWILVNKALSFMLGEDKK